MRDAASAIPGALRRPGRVLLLQTVVFLGAFLLFIIEPILGKRILPRYGGSAHVWTTCLLFFQAVLLGGYLFSHAAASRLRPSRHAILQMFLFALPLVAFPVGLRGAGVELPPVLGILLAMTLAVGLPFFVLSTVSIVTQTWIANSDLPERENPYVLYAASNLGSLLALIAFPFLVEPNLTVSEQLRWWHVGYGLLLLLALVLRPWTWVLDAPAPAAGTAGEGVGNPDVPRGSGAPAGSFPGPGADALRTSFRTKVWWFACAASASAYLLVATNVLTMDAAPVPLLWVAPLAVYLLTFILAFGPRPLDPRKLSGAWPALLALCILLQGTAFTDFALPELVFLHLAALFLFCLAAHVRLVASKPASTRDLTGFYLAISAGGLAGTAIIALVMPAVADTLFPDAMVTTMLLPASILFLAPASLRPKGRGVSGYTLVLVAIVLVGLWNAGRKPGTIHTTRNFYGYYRVADLRGIRILYHGTTLHGAQWLDPEKASTPTTYFHPGSPIGEALRSVERFRKVGIVGLGAGTLCSYFPEGHDVTIYELNPDNEPIARRFFTFLPQSKAAVRVVTGDARLSLEGVPPGTFDLLVLDGFSSDSVPVHLLTREAIALYRSRIRPDGVLLFNISNRYLDLAPVLAAEARTDPALAAATRFEKERKFPNLPSKWFAISADREWIAGLVRNHGWRDVLRDPKLRPARVWTDDYSNIFATLWKERGVRD